MEDYDGKSVGLFGAPACRCTTTTVAMGLLMAGIIAVGVGAVMVGFLTMDLLALVAGSMLMVIGLICLVVSTILFVYGSRQAHERLAERSNADNYSYAPSTSAQTTSPASVENVGIPIRTPGASVTPEPKMGAASVARDVDISSVDAPPPYDSLEATSKTKVVTAGVRQPPVGLQPPALVKQQPRQPTNHVAPVPHVQPQRQNVHQVNNQGPNAASQLQPKQSSSYSGSSGQNQQFQQHQPQQYRQVYTQPAVANVTNASGSMYGNGGAGLGAISGVFPAPSQSISTTEV